LAALTVPIAVYFVLQGEFVVRVILGSEWLGLVPTFRILAIAGVIQAPASTVGLVMMSLGRAERQLRIGLANSVVVVVAFLVGLPFGIEGVALGYVVANYAMLPVMLWYSYRGSPVHVSDFGRAMLPSLAAVLAAALASGAIILSWPDDSIERGVVVLTAFVLVYSLACLVQSSMRAALRTAWEQRPTREAH
jgi:PST family polysaccharide transporter